MNSKKFTTIAALAIGILVLGGCSAAGSSANQSTDSSNMKIGLLLPQNKVPRFEGKDKPYFQKKLKEICSKCTLLYANAEASASKQQQQAESMLAQGVKVLVVDPFDSVAAGSIVSAADAKSVPVISYDRLITSKKVDFSISNNYEKAGRLQAKALLEKLKSDGLTPSDGGIIMLNGADTDTSGLRIEKGAMSVIGKSDFKILAKTSTWDPTVAQNFTASQITKFGQKILAIYSANDGNGLAAVAALKAANADIVPITGQDAELAAVQAILAGDMYMTIYNSFKSEAYMAAEAAVALANGKKPSGKVVKVSGIPTRLVEPVVVTKDNIKSTVIKDGFYTADQICTGVYAKYCDKADIK